MEKSPEPLHNLMQHITVIGHDSNSFKVTTSSSWIKLWLVILVLKISPFPFPLYRHTAPRHSHSSHTDDACSQSDWLCDKYNIWCIHTHRYNVIQHGVGKYTSIMWWSQKSLRVGSWAIDVAGAPHPRYEMLIHWAGLLFVWPDYIVATKAREMTCYGDVSLPSITSSSNNR